MHRMILIGTVILVLRGHDPTSSSYTTALALPLCQSWNWTTGELEYNTGNSRLKFRYRFSQSLAPFTCNGAREMETGAEL